MRVIFGSPNQDGEEMLAFEVTDDALERAARIVKEGGVATIAFCSGLDTCPA